MKHFKIISLAFVLFPCAAAAQVILPPLFTDNMVLQQKSEAPVWGKASPGSVVTVDWNSERYATTADDRGEWRISVKTPEAGGPYSMTVSDGTDIRIDNICVGEVWLCSGQSNMEMPVKGWGMVKDYENELKDADNYPQIRLLQVTRNTSPVPVDDFEAAGCGWKVCSAENIALFSAVAYFYAREIHLRENVPVGVINTSWGGTAIESWMSRGSLQGVEGIEEDAEEISTYPAGKKERAELYMEQVGDWEAELADIDCGYTGGKPVWASKDMDDLLWQQIAVPCVIESMQPGFDGVVWLRKEVEIPQGWSGQELTLSLCAVDDWDYTYFNGEQIGKGYGWNVQRKYHLPASLVKGGRSVITVRCIDTGGEGGIYGKADSLYIEGPGAERISLAGEWKYRISKEYGQIPVRPTDTSVDPGRPTLLYNAMINPLVPFAIKGVIWYQGCANVGRAEQYAELLQLLIGDWRQAWGYDFPFYIAQLANFKTRQTVPSDSEWAELREAQEKASMTVGNSGIAVLIDIGDADDIHPKNKQEAARRLSLLALEKDYGHKVTACGPVLMSYRIEGDRIRLYFSDTANGLECRGDRLEGFAVAGADGKFHWGEAVIDGDTVVVGCKDVPMPLHVRYAWGDNPLGNLYSSSGLPASPFRTGR